jgi:hypothetical protein
LALSIDKKRLELLGLKQAQLAAAKQQDPALEKQIAETMERVRGYEARRAAEVEAPKGVFRLGRKQADGSIVAIDLSQRAATEAAPAAE